MLWKKVRRKWTVLDLNQRCQRRVVAQTLDLAGLGCADWGFSKPKRFLRYAETDPFLDRGLD